MKKFDLTDNDQSAKKNWTGSLRAALLVLSKPPQGFNLFRRSFTNWAAGVLAGAVTAWIIYEMILQHNSAAWWFVSVPLVILPYLAYCARCRKLKADASRAIETSRLHLSAIEALSNAIEAREQLTPGHIRRVRIYAVELGKIMNLSADELRALELAALLHGIGKLAVPDYILNKPGGLTVKEKERVKLYPLIGAEVVESVAFPYPVADAVRYCNECWDGSGYPDNLRGAEIPVIAQILGLADAYDTMREERPYRAACSRHEARRMLLAVAGARFDAKLVDLFLRSLARFEDEIIERGLPLDGAAVCANDAAEKSRAPTYLTQIRQTNLEVYAVYELARMSGATLDLAELLPFLSKKVQALVPCDTCAIYLYDEVRRTARAVHTSGKNAAFMRDRTVQFGEGAIGFALKNEKSVSSINPALDLTGDYAAALEDYTTMAVLPLRAGKRLVGALTVYSNDLLSYHGEHLRLLETAAHVVADAVARAMQQEESEQRALTDSLTKLPNARSLTAQFEKEVSRSNRSNRPFQFLMLDLDDFKKVNDTFGHKTGDDLLCGIAKVLREQLRDYDFLARYAGDEFVVIVPEISSERIHELCRRIETAVLSFAQPVDQERTARVGISIGTASYPADGTTLDQLLVVADQNMYSEKSAHKTRKVNPLTIIEDAQIIENTQICLQSIN